ncbi:hypothetical protein G6L37_06320 [Agrobacterium rubi]|nr:hypothetical protein [Agrobacterium rubi]NTF24977.1 hypothetical protein [Agrobacterium rubi]
MIDGSSLAAVLAAQLATDRRSFLMNSSFVLLGVALLWLLGWSLQTTLPFGVEIVPQITALMMFFTAAGTLGALFWALMGFAGGVGGKDFIRSDALENAAEICGFGDRAIYLFREGRIQVIRIDAIGSMVIEDRFLRIYSRFGDPSARIIVAEQDVSLMTTVIDRLRSRIA